jgi:hypothetical protein
MFSRVTQLEIDTLRIDIDEAVAMYREEIVPMLEDQPGYEGAYVLTNPSGQSVLITFWDSEEGAEETPFYSDAMARYVTLFRAPPGRESYEVKFADAPSVLV